MIATPAWLDRAAWPYTPHSHRTWDGELHYVDEGSGSPIVLVHGTPTWSFEWRHVIADLAPRHRVVAIDHLGFGLSERPAHAHYAPEAHAARFAHFMDARCEAFGAKGPADAITLVIHDFGGPIALDWALEHLHAIRRIIVVNSWMWSFTDDPLMSKRAAMIDNAFGRLLYRAANVSLRVIMPSAYADRRRLTRAIHAQYLAPFTDAASRERVLFALAHALRASAPFFDTLFARCERLAQVPVDIVWGLRDSAFPPAMLERWRAICPHAIVHEMAESGHWPHEEQPEDFVRMLRRILGDQ